MADLELNEISKNFGGVVALENATFHCNTGEIHGLIGQNGAGKSTLVKILSGVVERDEGEILLSEKKLDFNNPGDAIIAEIGMVFQELSLIPDLRVSQNILIGAEKLGRSNNGSRKDERNICYELFDRMGIDVADPDRSVNELTLAQRQMVEIAKVLWRDPKVIDGSRRRRIAAGSGTTVQDVNRLLKQFVAMQKMMKQFGKLGKRGKLPSFSPFGAS